MDWKCPCCFFSLLSGAVELEVSVSVSVSVSYRIVMKIGKATIVMENGLGSHTAKEW